MKSWRLSLLIALLITAKSVFLSWFVIPPADIPDESGHYAYVQDIASGNLLPLLGQATIPNDLWRPSPPERPDTAPTLPRVNYIVQHPPLYYAIAALPYSITHAVTDDRWYLIRATRLISALSLGVIIIVLFKTLRDVGLQAHQSILLAASIAFVPTLSNLSAGITNDIFLVLMSALATRHLVRFVLHNRLPDAYATAFWLTMAGATKMTAWIMIAGFVAILLYELRLPMWRWLIHATGMTALALAAPVWWMVRNVLNFGTPFYIGLGSPVPVLPDATIAQLMANEPFFYFMLVHFYALFGFSGYCQSAELEHLCVGTQITHVNNEPFFLFLLIVTVIAIAVAVVSIKHLWQHKGDRVWSSPGGSIQSTLSQLMAALSTRIPHRWLTVTVLAVGGAMLVASMMHVHQEPGFFGGQLVSFLVLLPLFLTPLALLSVASTSDEQVRLMHYGLLVFMLFGLLFIRQAHIAYVIVGAMKGIQGRYFFPFLPLMMVSAAIALRALDIRAVHYLWIALLLLLAETYTYVQHVIPFFEAVRI